MKDVKSDYSQAKILIIYVLQQWHPLNNPAIKDVVTKVPTMQQFADIELIRDRIHDKKAILTCRDLLNKHGLDEQIFKPFKVPPFDNTVAPASGSPASIIAGAVDTQCVSGGDVLSR